MRAVKFEENDSHTYMGLDSTTKNGTLRVQIRDVATMHQRLGATVGQTLVINSPETGRDHVEKTDAIEWNQEAYSSFREGC